MISASANASINEAMMVEVVAFDLPESPTLLSVFVEVRHCGDKAVVVDQPHYNSK